MSVAVVSFHGALVQMKQTLMCISMYLSHTLLFIYHTHETSDT